MVKLWLVYISFILPSYVFGQVDSWLIEHGYYCVFDSLSLSKIHNDLPTQGLQFKIDDSLYTELPVDLSDRESVSIQLILYRGKYYCFLQLQFGEFHGMQYFNEDSTLTQRAFYQDGELIGSYWSNWYFNNTLGYCNYADSIGGFDCSIYTRGGRLIRQVIQFTSGSTKFFRDFGENGFLFIYEMDSAGVITEVMEFYTTGELHYHLKGQIRATSPGGLHLSYQTFSWQENLISGTWIEYSEEGTILKIIEK